MILFPSAAACAEAGSSAFEVLLVSEPTPQNDFGVDMYVNMETLVGYLNLSDAIYWGMRMPVEPK